jgi:hypothetical protein
MRSSTALSYRGLWQLSTQSRHSADRKRCPTSGVSCHLPIMLRRRASLENGFLSPSPSPLCEGRVSPSIFPRHGQFGQLTERPNPAWPQSRVTKWRKWRQPRFHPIRVTTGIRRIGRDSPVRAHLGSLQSLRFAGVVRCQLWQLSIPGYPSSEVTSLTLDAMPKLPKSVA